MCAVTENKCEGRFFPYLGKSCCRVRRSCFPSHELNVCLQQLEGYIECRQG